MIIDIDETNVQEVLNTCSELMSKSEKYIMLYLEKYAKAHDIIGYSDITYEVDRELNTIYAEYDFGYSCGEDMSEYYNIPYSVFTEGGIVEEAKRAKLEHEEQEKIRVLHMQEVEQEAKNSRRALYDRLRNEFEEDNNNNKPGNTND